MQPTFLKLDPHAAAQGVSSAEQAGVVAMLREGLALHRRGRTGEAAALYRQALAVDPRSPDAWHLLGLTAYQEGRYGEAVKQIGNAIELMPTAAVFHANLANALKALGQVDHALAACVESLRLAPEVPEVLCTQAVLHRVKGELETALALLKRAIGLRPSYAEGHNNLGVVFEAQQQLDEAEACYREALRLKPDYLEAVENLGNLLIERNDRRAHEAVALFHRAVSLAPDRVTSVVALGRALHAFGALRDAEATFRQALARDSACVPALVALGNNLRERSRVAEAAEVFFQATELAPNMAFAHHLLGVTYDNLGRHDLAAAEFRRAVTLRPGLSSAWQQLLACRRITAADLGLVGEVEAQLARATTPRDLSNLHFALGKAYDDLGRYDEAFVHYQSGNTIENATVTFSIAEHRAHFDALIENFSEDFLAAHRECGGLDERPIFIVGMPRSGTTLVEQVVSGHSQVFGAGELPLISRILVRLPVLVGTGKPYPACVGGLTPELAGGLRRDYLAALDEYSAAAARVTDKMPGNFQALGLIALLFPRAKIIHCRRNPLDTCLSNFFQNFAGDHPYAYDLANLGHYYAEYRRLMAHWRKVLPSTLLYEIDYETLVGNLSAESRKLLGFLGLEWEERCVDIQQNVRAVQTASKWQVRQPVYQTSRARWRNYSVHLGPLIQSLAEGGIVAVTCRGE